MKINEWLYIAVLAGGLLFIAKTVDSTRGVPDKLQTRPPAKGQRLICTFSDFDTEPRCAYYPIPHQGFTPTPQKHAERYN